MSILEIIMDIFTMFHKPDSQHSYFDQNKNNVVAYQLYKGNPL